MTDVVETSGGWTFLTNHSHVLISLARDPDLRLRDLAELVGITERAVQTILRDLEAGGYISRRRVGRRNRYDVHPDRPMRHPVEAGHRVVEILQVLVVPSEEPDDIAASGGPDAGADHQPAGPDASADHQPGGPDAGAGHEPEATGGRPDGPV
ncbi:MAG: winged helix-turn-helix transcriptional regulator [Nitriliruptoraceae bacterium]